MFEPGRDSEIADRIDCAVLASAHHLVKAIEGMQSLEVRRKADKSLVTHLDMESQEILLQALEECLPCVAEEDPDSHGLLETSSDCIVIDPLDGTSACKRFMSVTGGQVGFGPLVGLVRSRRVVAVSFYNIPQRQLYSARAGAGARCIHLDKGDTLEPFEARQSLHLMDVPPLEECAAVFYTGPFGEARYVEYLRSKSLIENAYRFGGFANDCTRLAEGYEQIQIQFSVKSWDFPAALLVAEAGFTVVVNPLHTATLLNDWQIAAHNPILVAPPDHIDSLLHHFSAVSG